MKINGKTEWRISVTYRNPNDELESYYLPAFTKAEIVEGMKACGIPSDRVTISDPYPVKVLKTKTNR